MIPSPSSLHNGRRIRFLPSIGARRSSAATIVLFAVALFCGGVQAQNFRITELLAVNSNGIHDEDDTPQGWIEIWNATTTSKAAITGCKLTNGTATWTFPAFELMPDERIIVWASGKNRTVSTAPLHLNFTLSPTAGSTLKLLRADNSTLSDLSGYPLQTADVSWGRDEWDVATIPTQVGKYENPTPGERNNYSGFGVTDNVVISVPSKAYTGSLSVSLAMAHPDPSAVIRYTLTGSPPNAASTIYSGPLTVTTTQMIRARAYKPGFLPSEIESTCYLLLDASTSSFSSAIPIAAITNFTTLDPPNDGDQAGYLWVWEPAAPDNRSRMTNTPTLVSRIVMDRRGSSTLGNPKFNMNVETRSARDDDDRNVSLLGMPEESDWIFHAPYDWDRALIRNPFSYELSNIIGTYAPRHRMAEVFYDKTLGALTFTGAASGDYFGVFNLMEKIRRGNDRVNVQSLDQFENDPVNKTGGYIWKVDRLDSGDSGFSAGGQFMAYYYPKEIEIKSPQRDPQELYLTATINAFNTALQGANFKDPTVGYAAHMDVPNAIDHHLVNTWTNNLDAFRLSGYWHKRIGGKMIPGPVWDFDRSIDSTDGRDDNPASWRGSSDGTDFFNYTWWNRLFQDIDFYQKLIDRWQELRRGVYSQTSINALIDGLNNAIGTEAVARDLTRWGRTKRAYNSLLGAGNLPAGQPAEILRMKEYMQLRANFMDSQWVGPVTASVPPGQVTPGTQFTLTGPASSVIYYTLNGADPRPSGGAETGVAGVLTYIGTPITVNATTRLRARAYKTTHTALTGGNNPFHVSKWSGLTNNLYSTDIPAAPGNLAITEINYHPTGPTPAETAINAFWGDDDFEWVELRNLTGSPINLANCQFNLGIFFSFTSDNAVSIPGGGYLILAANPAAFVARYGSSGQILGPFSGNLSNDSDRLRLLAANSSVIMDLTYEDTWQPESDGGGRTLAVFDPRASVGDFYGPENWRASATINGSPRAAEPNLPPIITVDSYLEMNIGAVSLNAMVRDDSQPEPPQPPVLQWSKVSGPGSVSFSDGGAQPGVIVTCSLPGVYVLRLSANDGALIGSGDVMVAVRDTVEAWQARHPGIGALLDDIDGDGSTNLTEFVLRTDPLTPGGSPPISTARENGRLLLTFTRTAGAVTTEIQASNDLTNFVTAPSGEFRELILESDGVTETVQIMEMAPATPDRRFVRLRFSIP